MSIKNLVSVIIPAYNAEKYIAETLSSVFEQTYSDIEVIVVDDGSTDQTENVISKFKNKVLFFKQKNSGVSSARNFAVEQAKGEWLAFLDADDLWLPNKLALQMEKIESYQWSHMNSLYIGENQDNKTTRSDLTEQFGGGVFSKLIINNFITTSTVLIKKELFLSYKGFDESLDALEDWQLWLNISATQPIKYQPEVLTHYRIYDGSTSRKARFVLPLHLKVIEKTFADDLSLPNKTDLKNNSLSEAYMICSYIAEDSNDTSFSLYCPFNAWKKSLFSFLRFKRFIRTLIKHLFNI